MRKKTKYRKLTDARLLSAVFGPHQALALAVLAKANDDERQANRTIAARTRFKSKQSTWEHNGRVNEAINTQIGLGYFNRTKERYGRVWWEDVAGRLGNACLTPAIVM